jgi:subtilisin family serine protease
VWGGGWTKVGDRVPPGTPSDSGHGAMVARTVGLAAPQATYFDCRILPPVIDDIEAFLEDAQDAYHQMIIDIWRWRWRGEMTGPWIFVNAWGIYSRLPEDPPGDYTSRWDHPFNLLMSLLCQLGFDTVFAAGNCGQFCPKQRCGPDDRGPGNSILGANSHPRVLTTGAVRTDGLWLGYSSQGPGRLDPYKPDLCAPAQFRDDGDASLLNTGTSAACGVAAGVAAALRGRWGPEAISPTELRNLLCRMARSDGGPHWDPRLGNGILDAAAAWRAAQALYP